MAGWLGRLDGMGWDGMGLARVGREFGGKISSPALHYTNIYIHTEIRDDLDGYCSSRSILQSHARPIYKQDAEDRRYARTHDCQPPWRSHVYDVVDSKAGRRLID